MPAGLAHLILNFITAPLISALSFQLRAGTISVEKLSSALEQKSWEPAAKS
jgi:hypothetical protein